MLRVDLDDGGDAVLVLHVVRVAFGVGVGGGVGGPAAVGVEGGGDVGEAAKELVGGGARRDAGRVCGWFIMMGQYAVIREAVSTNIQDKPEKNPSEKPKVARTFLKFGVNI